MDIETVTKTDNLHPLLIELILEQIFGLLLLKDLKSCRQVCKLWCGIASKKFKDVAYVDIGGKKGRKDAKDFLELVSRKESTFTQMPLINSYSIAGSKKHPIPFEFWGFCGSSMKALLLQSTQFIFDSGEDFRHMIFVFCPNLTWLKLVYFDTPQNPKLPFRYPLRISIPPNANLKVLGLVGGKFFDLCPTEFLHQYPEIEDFCMDGPGEKRIEKLFSTLNSKCSSGEKLWPLKSLTFNFDEVSWPEGADFKIGKLNMSLEALHVSCLSCPLHIHLLRDMLGDHISTLKDLSIRSRSKFGFRNIIPLHDGGFFKCLESMMVLNFTFASINDLSFFPNIKKLTLCCSSFTPEFRLDYEETFWELDNCTELNINFLHTISIEDLRVLLKKFPNVEKLKYGRCTNENLSVICGLLPKLVHLDLGTCTVNDTGICGWDAEDVEEFQRNPGWRPISVPRANISSLKYLKHFSWEKGVLGSNLGVCAAIHGVKLLPGLISLRIVEENSLPIWNQLCKEFPYSGN